RRGAGDRLAAGHRPGTGLAGEVALEDVPVQVGLLRQRRVDREAAGGEGELAASHLGFGVGLQPVDPCVTHPVAELLLLAPEDGLRKVAGEGLAQYGFFDRAPLASRGV